MSSIAGTVIAAKITTGDTVNTFPVADANDIQGGHHTVATLTDRDAIPAERRAEGMTCHVTATGISYTLAGGITNAAWSYKIGVNAVVSGTEPANPTDGLLWIKPL